MKVILQKDVPALGDAGDIKEVAEGYARNYLLPNRLVIVANESSRKAIEHQKKLIKIKKDKRKKASEGIAGSISGLEITIPAQVGEEGKLFGSITTMDIAKQLKEKGFTVDKRKIQLDAPIRQEGEYTVSIKLDEGINASVKVIVVKE
ncbi:MAG TPA: 50S ribosomal protein L9 [Spirochaetota bacterium]|nr:50S ribosomal protein L9 [Spirochaetota bacterium]HQO41227.1 50S ribosomal protein L9 [Spirochaetota bacterium]